MASSNHNQVFLYEEDVPGAKLMKDPKDELVERVQMNLGKIKIDPNVDGGKWYQLKKNGSFISPPDVQMIFQTR